MKLENCKHGRVFFWETKEEKLSIDDVSRELDFRYRQNMMNRLTCLSLKEYWEKRIRERRGQKYLVCSECQSILGKVN